MPLHEHLKVYATPLLLEELIKPACLSNAAFDYVAVSLTSLIASLPERLALKQAGDSSIPFFFFVFFKATSLFFSL